MEIAFYKLERKHQKEVIDIFNYYVENSTAAYREKAVNENFILNFLESSHIYRSYIIVDNTNKIIGFCTLEPYVNISTFTETAEVMYFIHHEYTGKGIGSIALKKMEDEARKLGIKHLIADVSTENRDSITFHKKHGFIECGKLPNIGMKFNRRFGIVYLLKELL